jgi:uncharacterized protein YbjT (DUF2867 family)
MTDEPLTIAVLGASGLIGAAIAESLLQDGFSTVTVARRHSPAQAALLGRNAVTYFLAEASAADLGDLLRSRAAAIVVNCLGVLQDGPRGRTAEVHEAFVSRLVAAIQLQSRPVLLIHLSVPGQVAEDDTQFSRTKRAGERLIAAADIPSVVLRPGFVIAPAAYGGSALLRALAALPLALAPAIGARPFAATAIDDITQTVSLLARRWAAGERHWKAVWDLCEREPATVATTVEAFRVRFGGPRPLIRAPASLLWLGAAAGDAAAWLGWSPPVRTTALREMLRGVEGEPDGWIAATGVEPASLAEALRRLPSTVQERWFARLYVLKALVLAVLAGFWVLSGAIALTVAFRPASAVLSSHGVAPAFAEAITFVTSLIDIAVGLAIAVRRTSRVGLLAGIAVSLGYVASAAVLTPELWADPLGPLVKIGPAVVLMLVALAILEAR